MHPKDADGMSNSADQIEQSDQGLHCFPHTCLSLYEPPHDKTNKMTFAPSKDSDQQQGMGERGGSVVECRTPEREVRGSRPTAAVLCP